MMMSGFVERVINSPRDALPISQTGGPSDVQRTSEGKELQFPERLVPDDWACNRETSHPQRGRCPWWYR